MPGDFLEILILIGIFALSTLFGGKKKKAQARRRSAPAVKTPPASQAARRTVDRAKPAVRARAEATRAPDPIAAPSPGRQWTSPESMVQDIVDLLAAQKRAVEVEPAKPEAVAQPIPEREAPESVSLETLEPAGGASHVKFHEDFIRPLEKVTGRQAASATRRLRARLGTGLREAIVLTEILGPPKGWKS